MTVPIKGKCWCWLCKSHSPEEVCPRKNEIGTEYGQQRLKELLQEMVKVEEKVDVGEERNGEVPKENQETWFLGTQPFITTKGEPVGPKIIQPPEGKKPHIKPVEVGGRAQWPTKPTTSTPSTGTSSAGGQLPRKLTQGSSNIRGRELEMNRGGQPPPRPSPRENGRGGRNGNGDGGDDGDDDGDDDEDEDDEDAETVTESESGEDPNAPGGGGVPEEPGGGGGGGDGPPPNPGIGNVGPRSRSGHRGQREQRGWTGPQGVPGVLGAQGPQGPQGLTGPQGPRGP